MMAHAIIPVVCISLVLLATAACTTQPSGLLDFTGNIRFDQKKPKGQVATEPPLEDDSTQVKSGPRIIT